MDFGSSYINRGYATSIEYLDQNTVQVDVLHLLRRKIHIATSIVNPPSEHMLINKRY
jgi:hypothetical protein